MLSSYGKQTTLFWKVLPCRERRLMLLAIAAIVACTPVALNAKSPEVVTLGAEVWCPYACDINAKNPGIIVEAASKIFNDAGLQVEYKLMPWGRVLNSVSNGDIDAAIGVVVGNSGDLLLDTHGMGFDDTVFVTRADVDFKYSEPADLDQLAIGVTSLYTYDNNGPLDNYLEQRKNKKEQIVEVFRDQPLEIHLRMLVSNRIDVFLENRLVAEYEAQRLGFADQIQIRTSGTGDRVHIGFTPSKRGQELKQVYDEGLGRIIDNGELQEILDKYGISSLPDGSAPPKPQRK